MNKITCCNNEFSGRVFAIPPANKMRRVLVFLDECPICGRSRAVIKNVEFDGSVYPVVNRSGDKALELLNKYFLSDTGLHKVQGGSKSNLGWYFFDGLDLWVRDFNNTKICKLDNKCLKLG